jgi:sodium/potassium-transporting ATPase subunit alpha
MKEEQKNFPMENLTFIGIVSLNDPPRKRVDMSIQKCRRAGIKVIMVTGDQPVTAAAIANKIGIFTDLSKNKDNLVAAGLSEEEALEQCQAIAVHGDLLAMKHLEEEGLDDNDPEKGRFLLNWIAKPEVVFARTTPSQKLLIVDACQRAGHVVAVTGDGVNDSPAIKKADIGIAMGICGSDVAKNAADMILLDDDFSSIVNGVEEGRLIFDNLKKSIAYTLSSNIPEIGPFIFFIITQVPLPLSTVLILCIDLGTDMIPAISFAYENPELDIMERKPRNSKRDHLVNTKLISFSYLQIGVVQAASGFYTYSIVMNDYGFKPATLFFLTQKQGYVPKAGDKYDPTAVNKGNSNVGVGERRILEWNITSDDDVDVRLFYNELPADSWKDCRFPKDDESYPKFYRISSTSDETICHSTEALRNAQCAYFISIICVQWADLLICKTRNLSISQQGLINKFSNFGIFFETTLGAILCYVQPFNIALGTRMIASPHFAIPSFPFFTIIFFYDECRKMFLRAGVNPNTGKWDGWVIQNTYY